MAESRKTIKRAWFKQHQRKDIYHYIEVVGGEGKTKDDYQVVINFLNSVPRIDTWYNFVHDASGLTGTWCRYEVSEPVTEAEFQSAMNRALSHPEVKVA
jgi:hypothetical protein